MLIGAISDLQVAYDAAGRGTPAYQVHALLVLS